MMNPDDIYAEVEQRKERARKLGIGDTVIPLYYNHLKFYPAWTKNSPKWISPTVSEAVDLGDHKVRLKINGRSYTFSYSERSVPGYDETFTMGTLQITLEDQKVFECDVHVDYEDELETKRTPGDIKAFIEGQWIEELKNLLTFVLKHEAEQSRLSEKERRENPEKLMDLKKRFGLE